jgi:hypothetical protein
MKGLFFLLLEMLLGLFEPGSVATGDFFRNADCGLTPKKVC